MLLDVSWPRLRTIELSNNKIKEAAPAWFGPQVRLGVACVYMAANSLRDAASAPVALVGQILPIAHATDVKSGGKTAFLPDHSTQNSC